MCLRIGTLHFSALQSLDEFGRRFSRLLNVIYYSTFEKAYLGQDRCQQLSSSLKLVGDLKTS